MLKMDQYRRAMHRKALFCVLGLTLLYVSWCQLQLPVYSPHLTVLMGCLMGGMGLLVTLIERDRQHLKHSFFAFWLGVACKK